MIRVIDTFDQIPALYENGTFQLEKWERYINRLAPGTSLFLMNDMKEMLGSQYTFEKDVLPILDAVDGHPCLTVLHESFAAVTDRLNERVMDAFGKELDLDIVLYLGLCNGAGWATTFHGRNAVLLGVEKILECNWCDVDSMQGLVWHELGHLYHKQYGSFDQKCGSNGQKFIWQLFTEGIAMYFEQVLAGCPDYFHQNVNGWLAWCDGHLQQILADFQADLPTMTRETQRYFGDWADYHGHGDVGYYLGSRFVHHLIKQFAFDELIQLQPDRAAELFQTYAHDASLNV